MTDTKNGGNEFFQYLLLESMQRIYDIMLLQLDVEFGQAVAERVHKLHSARVWLYPLWDVADAGADAGADAEADATDAETDAGSDAG